MADDPIYLDHNATTPLLPEVVDAMQPYLRVHFGNPSSGHVHGRRARAAVDRARAQVAALIAADPDEVVFTSGGTEANNLAIRGVAAARPGRPRIVTTAVEHPATAAPCAWLEGQARTCTRVPVDARGLVDLDVARHALTDDTALLTVIHAHNETGVIQPIAALAGLAHAVGAVVHTDAAQSLGKLAVDVRALDVDLLSLAGHKLYAPKGVGALYVRQGTRVLPFTLGAGHERGLRPGTENVASIVGLGVACELAARDLDALARRLLHLRELLWSLLHADVRGLARSGGPEHCLPNTLSVRFPGVRGPDVLAAAPELAASTGSACHDGHDEPPAAIVAMGVPPAEALGTVRLTLGRSSDEPAVRTAAAALTRAWRSLQRA
ncbi:MAG: cysteine desulfurase [Myxococcales bacterium]|nr:cysteine desulfurase [Myxococcales bacterium]